MDASKNTKRIMGWSPEVRRAKGRPKKRWLKDEAGTEPDGIA